MNMHRGIDALHLLYDTAKPCGRTHIPGRRAESQVGSLRATRGVIRSIRDRGPFRFRASLLLISRCGTILPMADVESRAGPRTAFLVSLFALLFFVGIFVPRLAPRLQETARHHEMRETAFPTHLILSVGPVLRPLWWIPTLAFAAAAWGTLRGRLYRALSWLTIVSVVMLFVAAVFTIMGLYSTFTVGVQRTAG